MTIVPFRSIGKLGVNTDWSPLDLPPTAWTMGTNVRFVDDRIQRGPVFSSVGTLSSNTLPRFMVSYKTPDDNSKLMLLNQDGSITDFVASVPGTTPVQTDISAAGWTPSVIGSPYTATLVNNVLYVNRPDRVPWYKPTVGPQFLELPIWDSTWRCKSLRTVNNVLVAINITKGATNYATMVKTSDFTTFNSTPAAWTATTTNSATENVIGDLQEPLVDGWPLRDRLILYSNNETWFMEYRGDNSVFGYKRLFNNRGVLSQNCVTEHNNIHYVFGFNDIWTHDGYTNKSIAQGRVRDFIYNNLVRDQINQFFVVNNAKAGEVMFCYVSRDAYCYFPVGGNIGYPGCNRTAVYNYVYDTWSFYDLPYVVGAAVGLAYSGAVFDDFLSLSYDSVGGNYGSYFDANRLNMMTVSSSSVSVPNVGTINPAVRIFEGPRVVTGVSLRDTVATAPVYLENMMMDMDQIAQELKGYKVVNIMYPQATFEPNAPSMYFSWGSSDYSNIPVTYGNPMSFDGASNYKLDFNSPGRYLSLKMTYSGFQDFSFGGFDIDYQMFSHR